jgi:hypothetical protein
MYAVETDQHGGSTVMDTKKQEVKCRDPLFAVLFYINLGVIIAIAVLFGKNPFNVEVEENADDQAPQIDYTPFMYAAIISGGVGLILSSFSLQLLMCIPGTLIKVALISNIVLSFGMAVLAFMYGSMPMAILSLVIALLVCCYTYCIWSRIPFATANLKTGTTSIKANCGVTILAYAVVVGAFGWTLLWVVSLLGIQDSLVSCNEDGVCSSPNYLYLFLLFVSYFFTHQVLQNTIHTTIAGVVGSWWFMPDESGFCGSAVCGSFYRTLTTSFGSVCFGSLLVAIIEATRQLVESLRQNEELGSAFACVIDCVLGCLQGLIEYFNKWAYVYVGLYGFGYCEAGKNVMQLFRDRGWEAVIADDIVSTVLGLVALVAGLVTAGAGVLTAVTVDWFDEMIALQGDTTFVYVITGVVGFIVGFALCSIVMGVISSSVNATIVLFAEAPAEFESNHPELSREMRNAYQEAHPGSI